MNKSAVFLSLHVSADTVCSLLCCIYAQQMYVPVPQYVVGSGGDGTAGNETQIHHNKEIVSLRERDAEGQRALQRDFIEGTKEKRPLRLSEKPERDKT